MSLRQFVVAALALIGGAHAASSCCFVVQDEAHEIYWSEYTTETYTTAYNLTSITTLLTAYPTTTVTNYETNVYPINKVFTTTVLVTENPVSFYTNPAYAIPQRTEILGGSEPMVTGGVTVNSPTGFWVYSTAKVFAAPAVTDSSGNVACGTLSSFSDVAATAAACVPTFTGINGNAAANFDSNGGQGVEISLTTPFVHIPTRAGLQISPSEACVQGNGTENYGYPVQQLIDHLAGNAFYSAQYPGIENCIPAGPTIQAVEALAVAVTSPSVAADPPVSTESADPPSVSESADPAASTSADPATASMIPAAASSTSSVGGTTETPGGGLTSMTTIIVTVTGSTTSSSSSSVTTSAAPGSTTTTSVTSTSIPTALGVSTTSSSTTSTGGETVISGGLLPTSSSSSTSSLSVISPLMETTSSLLNSTSSQTAAPTSSLNSTVISTSQSSSSSLLNSTTSSLSTSSAAASSSVEVVLPSSVLVPENSNMPGFTSSTTTISSSAFVIVVPSATTSVGSTATVSTATGLPPVMASSAKEFVSWKLLFGITGLAAIGAW